MTARTTARRSVDRFDREVLQYVLLRAPYGPPPSDNCLPQFGIPAYRFDERFREIIAGYLGHTLNAQERRLIFGCGQHHREVQLCATS